MNNEIRILALSDDIKYFRPEKSPLERDWFDRFAPNFVKRCLPITICNTVGYVVNNPINFTCTAYPDKPHNESVKIEFENEHPANKYFNSHFGGGILTINTPMLCRTDAPNCVWVRGLPNHHKEHVHSLEGIVEAGSLNFGFTVNKLITKYNTPIHFYKGEPLYFFTLFRLTDPITLINAKLSDYPEIQKEYLEYAKKRQDFNDSERDGSEWMKDYVKGGTTTDRKCPFHVTNTKNEIVEFKS